MTAPLPYSLYWVNRGESVRVGGTLTTSTTTSCSVTDTSDAAPAARVSDAAVVSDALTFDALCSLMLASGEEFDPYPPCLPRHLRAVDAFLVAVAAAGSDKQQQEDSNSNEDGDNTSDGPRVAHRVLGAVGVAWVDLSVAPRTPANAVQGYLQIVVVPRAHRRRGIGRVLLTQLLMHTPDLAHSGTGKVLTVGRTSIGGAAPLTAAKPSVGVVSTVGGPTAILCPVSSWMLHTMAAGSIATRAYLKNKVSKDRRARTAVAVVAPVAETAVADDSADANAAALEATTAATAVSPSTAASHGGDDASIAVASPPPASLPSPSDSPSSSSPLSSVADEVEARLAGINAVTALYTAMGFVERRTLYRYYGGLADAVEMFRGNERWLKTQRRE